MRSAEFVAAARLQAGRRGESRQRCRWILKQLDPVVAQIGIRVRVHLQRGSVAAEDRVRTVSERGGGSVTQHGKREAGAPGVDSRRLPAADDFIAPPAAVAGKGFAPAERQVINNVARDLVSDVKFGIAFAGSKVDGVAENRLGVVKGIPVVVGNAGEIVDGVRERVVEIHLDALGKTLAENDDQSVVVRIGLVRKVVIADKLRGESHVRRKVRGLRQTADHPVQVTLLQRKKVSAAAVNELGAICEARTVRPRRRQLVLKERLCLNLGYGNVIAGIDLQCVDRGRKALLGSRVDEVEYLPRIRQRTQPAAETQNVVRFQLKAGGKRALNSERVRQRIGCFVMRIYHVIPELIKQGAADRESRWALVSRKGRDRFLERRNGDVDRRRVGVGKSR